jgi:cell wall-associated NlpC family hydrolase
MSMPALITVVVGVTLAVAPSVPQSPTQQDEPRLRGRSEADARLDRLVGEGASRHGTGDAGDSESMDESGGAAPYEGPYRSPYRLTLRTPSGDLLAEHGAPARKAGEESTIPQREWYSESVRKRCGGWGVPARKFECPPEVRSKPAEWKRERVVACASRFIGYEYQHHHVPDWDPPKDWPWNSCCAGKQGKGVDCSNFSGWNYNWSLGIHLDTDIHKQAAQATVPSSHGEVRAKVIPRPEGDPDQWYDTLCGSLLPGDLLYIMKDGKDEVSHVIMWLGPCASSPDGTPLVIDSTGGKIKDSNGHAIPCGIHMRPFNKGSWYHKRFGHAHRWIDG